MVEFLDEYASVFQSEKQHLKLVKRIKNRLINARKYIFQLD